MGFALTQPGVLFYEGSILLTAVALVPYFYALYRQPSARNAARLAFVFGFLTSLCSYYWLIFFQNFALWTVGSISLAHGGGHAILAVVLMRVMRMRPAYRPFMLALCWSSLEFLKSIWYLAFPWGMTGLALQESILLIQHIDITGIWSLNLLMSLLNALVLEGIIVWRDNRNFRRLVYQAAMVGVCFVAPTVYGIYRLANPPTVEQYVPLLIIQQNTDPWNEGARAALSSNILLTVEGLEESTVRPEMVLWSETSLRSAYIENREYYANNPSELPLQKLLADNDITLLTGAPYFDYGADGITRIYNGALLIDSNGQAIDYYGKRQLVPFAEHIPLWGNPTARAIMSTVIGLRGSWDQADRATLFEKQLSDGSTLKFGVLICFEDSFGYLARDYLRAGSDVLINLTNNSWSRRKSAQAQHLSSARLRAVEHRQALVRSTNSGISAVVDALGHVHTPLPEFEKGAALIEAPIYAHSSLTLYSRWGDWLGNLLVFAATTLYALTFHRRIERILMDDNRDIRGTGVIL